MTLFPLLCFLVVGCSTPIAENSNSTETILPTSIDTSTPVLSLTKTPIPTKTHTITLTSTPEPNIIKGQIFFDKNLSGEMDYEGEIPLEGITLEVLVDEVPYQSTTDSEGFFVFELQHDFDDETLELLFPDQDNLINPLNNHAFTTVAINLGQEKIVIPDDFANISRIISYERNKIDLFKTALPFSVSINSFVNLGLAHGEAAYWIPEFDLENTCILNYKDLDTHSIFVENYAGDTMGIELYGTKPDDRLCVDQYGTNSQHAGIDTTFLENSSRLVVSPFLGVVRLSRMDQDSGVVLISTKHGGFVYFGHMAMPLVETGQVIYPGDIIGIFGDIVTPPHVHVEYHITIPFSDKYTGNFDQENITPEMMIEAYRGLSRNSTLPDSNSQLKMDDFVNRIDEIHYSRSYSTRFTPSIDLFWYEPDWIPPEENLLKSGEGCSEINQQTYCVTYYKGTGSMKRYILHPSDGIFAAGNQIVPPEIFPEFEE